MVPEIALFIGKEQTSNIFQLLGYKEDDITAAIAWALSNSPVLLKKLLESTTGSVLSFSSASIHVHRYEEEKGITDIEILADDRVHIVVEAKRGWIVPGLEQLEKYSSRKCLRDSNAEIKRIVTLSEASNEYAEAHLPARTLNGIRIEHLSWRKLVGIVDAAIRAAGNIEKRLLNELRGYLIMSMHAQRKDSNCAYVVSLSTRTPSGWDTSWVDIVRIHRRYFHPISGSWPKEPPTYIAFRYYGQLQSIHYVSDYSVIDNLRDACAGIPDTPVEPHYLYSLDEAIVPANAVPTGNIYPSGRVWAALDTLLTSKTVSDARDITKRRMNAI